MMTIKLKTSSGELIKKIKVIVYIKKQTFNYNTWGLCNPGVENKEDIHHLDHEIKELNNSNMKIEEDMMHLQTQVSIYCHRLCSKATVQGDRCSLNLMSLSSVLNPKADLVDGMQPEDNWGGKQDDRTAQ